MASASPLQLPSLLSTQQRCRRPLTITHAAPTGLSNAKWRENERTKAAFKEARRRCELEPMDGVPFTLEEFFAALDDYEVDSQVGARVKGTISVIESNGAFVDIASKSSAFLPVEEASMRKIGHISESSLYPGLKEDFVVIGHNADDNSLILSLRSVQYHVAWERCQQLRSEDAMIIGEVLEQKRGGLLVKVEGLNGFLPFSQIPLKSKPEYLKGKKLLLKLLEVDEQRSKLVLGHCTPVTEQRPQTGIGDVATGTVKSVKSYGAFVDVDGITGLLHISQISHYHILDIATVLQPGDKLKVMIINYHQTKVQLSLSTKKLEPTPGDMIRNPKLVFEKAEEMAQIFRQKVSQAEALACTNSFKIQSHVSSA